MSSGPHEVDYSQFTHKHLKAACRVANITLTSAQHRKREDLVQFLRQMSPADTEEVQAILQRSNKRKYSRIASHSPERCEVRPRLEIPLESNRFLRAGSEEIIEQRTAAFIDRTSTNAMRLSICAVCARKLPHLETRPIRADDIPHSSLLRPTVPHAAQKLHGDLLLYPPAIDAEGNTRICVECEKKLAKDTLPAYALANNMWIGEIPHELKVLTLPERILIAKYFPVAYIVKLFPKARGAQFWDRQSLNSGLKGNVSTYHLDPSQIRDMIQGNVMPPPAQILAATIGVTFVGPKMLPERMLPDMFLVQRHRVANALRFLKSNNPIFENITICPERLAELPINGVPEQILATSRYSSDTMALDREQEGYVPADEEEVDMNDLVYGAPGVIDVEEPEPAYQNIETEPSVIPLQALGVVDVAGDDVPDHDVLAHALSNSSTEHPHKETFYVRRGSAFVNEYARMDQDTKQRFDGGPSNANHLLGSFPVLFPYGMGGFEVGRPVDVPYESHARWALQYVDKRFRLDLHFVFQVFGVIQKRRICRSACLQIQRASFLRHERSIRSLKPADLLKASKEETRGVPFSNPAVQALRSQLTAVRVRVPGTDESRAAIRGDIWGTTLMFNPPSIWATINLSDTQDPIAQVLTGVDIDLDNFNPTLGPVSSERGNNIASDPYAASNYFHIVIKIILEEIFGISAPKGGHIKRQEGILGVVKSYIGTRGTLHLHIVLWLEDAPTSAEMREALKSTAFQEKIRQFIKVNIRADLDGADTATIAAMPRTKEVAYSRPIDPRKGDFQRKMREREKVLARAVQLHQCSLRTCQRVMGHRLVCKRRAPFPLSPSDWVTVEGECGPRRICGYLNNWNPTLLNVLRSNHDMKLITNGYETKSITWYITNYATKKQQKSSNTSALIAHRLAHHKQQEQKAVADFVAMNKQLIQRCANTLSRDQEFSAPEVMSYLMGWGDRYESHHYVSIYWDTAVRTLKRHYPALKLRSHLEQIAEAEGVPYHEEQGRAQQSEVERLHLQDGKLTAKNDLNEYQERGHALRDENFLDFMLNTYDGPRPTPAETTGDGTQSRTRLRSERVPYKEGSGRDKRCRIIRGRGHETLPHFVGPWFPRNDRPELREMYCASMLLLLSPWQTLADLKGANKTFENSFCRFQQTAGERVNRILDNIQYYHECSDGARKRAEGENGSAGWLDVENAEDENLERGDGEGEAGLTSEITDADIEHGRWEAMSGREYDFGDSAMTVAFDVGIFPEDPAATVYKQAPRNATFEDMATFNAWEAKLKSITRMANADVIGSDQNEGQEETPAIIRQLTRDGNTTPSVVVQNPVRNPGDREARTLPHAREKLASLNDDQRRAHTIIEKHLVAHLAGEKPSQLLMLVLGAGGTGKSRLIEAITETFEYHAATQILSKTASTGVAASLIGGQTLHGWAGIPASPKKEGDWTETRSKATIAKRKANIGRTEYLAHDEAWMNSKTILAALSEICWKVKAGEACSEATKPFGGMNMIMFGDPHQFPPVRQANGALYMDRPSTDSKRALLGREIYLQFTTVVILKEQKRIRDPVWNRILNNLRGSGCEEDDLQEIRKLMLTDESCDVPDFSQSPWSEAVLVTSRHGVRSRWNTASLMKHCSSTGNRLYVSQAEDRESHTGARITKPQKLVSVGMKVKDTGRLPERTEIAIGMKAMVLTNIATEADIANGTRGTVVDIVLDVREEVPDPDEVGMAYLQYPPAVILFKPDVPPKDTFEGLPPGMIPLSPTEVTFPVMTPDGRKSTIRRRQLAITPAYAFTDYRSQGQTIEYVIVDLAKPPEGKLTGFNAYVALSRSRGRGTIRLLRDCHEELSIKHPSDDLLWEDERLARLDKLTV